MSCGDDCPCNQEKDKTPSRPLNVWNVVETAFVCLTILGVIACVTRCAVAMHG